MEAHSAAARPHGAALPRSRRLLAAFSDERLVEQLRRGNEAAFEAIFDRHHRGILAFARHMLASVEEAEDVVQHTFVQAYDSVRRTDRDIKLKAWLYTIARNRCLSILRARREQAAELDDIPTERLSDAVHQRSELRELLADIRELPEEQRAALVLSEVGDLSHADIASVIGCEASKVKSLVFQARSSLMETRKAREIPCHEIREQLATASGGALRRGPLRRHVKQCPGCAEFRDDVQRQRKMLAAALPVIPSVALKHSALAAVGIGTGASAAGGGAAAGGGIASLVGSGGAKVAAIVAVAGATVGSGVAITEQVGGGSSGESAVPAKQSAPKGSGSTGSGAGAAPAKHHAGGASHRRRHGGASHRRDGASAKGRHERDRGTARGGSGHENGGTASQDGRPTPHVQPVPDVRGGPSGDTGSTSHGNSGGGTGNRGRHLGTYRGGRGSTQDSHGHRGSPPRSQSAPNRSPRGPRVDPPAVGDATGGKTASPRSALPDAVRRVTA